MLLKLSSVYRRWTLSSIVYSVRIKFYDRITDYRYRTDFQSLTIIMIIDFAVVFFLPFIIIIFIIKWKDKWENMMMNFENYCREKQEYIVYRESHLIGYHLYHLMSLFILSNYCKNIFLVTSISREIYHSVQLNGTPCMSVCYNKVRNSMTYVAL